MRRTDIDQRIGRNLRKIRLAKNMMQIDVVIAAKRNRTYISRIETGKARATLKLLNDLCLGLDIKPTDLIKNNNFVKKNE